MKITLKDFGPISHFEFDLEKDLHVIFGKNNIGKSYAITAVYLVIKHITSSTDILSSSLFLHHNSQIIKYEEDKLINEPKNSANEYIDLTKSIANTFGALMHQFFQKVGQSFNNSFPPYSQLVNSYTKNDIYIELAYRHFTIVASFNININALYVKSVDLNFPIVGKLNSSNFNLSQETVSNYSLDKNTLDFSHLIWSLYECFENEVAEKINKVYFLPASRSGLYQGLGAFSSIIAELSKNRNLITSKIEFPTLSEPVSDYFLSLSSIDNDGKNDFNDIIENIEQTILKGEVLFNTETKKIVFKQYGISEQLDLSFSSSMVSEIAPIIAYLKYIIKSETIQTAIFSKPSEFSCLLFIEEPEAHLHPEVQVKLMEMFTLLAGKNVKIVMTSHSNYMFNKLSNLLLENKIDHNKVSSYLMRATDKGSVTDMLSMKAESEGINDENFADIAEQLYEERIKIYDQLNKGASNVD